MFFRTIEPFIAQANNASANTIKRVLSVGAPIPPGNALATVRPAVEATYADLNIDPSEVGSYGAKQALNCPQKSAAGVAAVPAGKMTLGLLVAVLLVLVV